MTWGAFSVDREGRYVINGKLIGERCSLPSTGIFLLSCASDAVRVIFEAVTDEQEKGKPDFELDNDTYCDFRSLQGITLIFPTH
jgi:hypothetical protein